MPDPRDPLADMTPEEIARLRALGDKRVEAYDRMNALLQKQNDARRNIIDKMR